MILENGWAVHPKEYQYKDGGDEVIIDKTKI
jgi:hypothetical protein